jgi:hypothetical protein
MFNVGGVLVLNFPPCRRHGADDPELRVGPHEALHEDAREVAAAVRHVHVAPAAPLHVRPHRCCPPRHPTHFEPSFLNLNGSLRRGEQCLAGTDVARHVIQRSF